MRIVIGDLLSLDDLNAIRTLLSGASFVDGGATAGPRARAVKANEQAKTSDPSLEPARVLIERRLQKSALFEIAIRPKHILPLLFSRYRPGMHYGSHVDNALMRGMRSDVAFTIFLSEPDSYEGGELVIESAAGADPIKLPAGAIVAYPATSLHYVADVTRGERLAAVGWVRSYIRDAAKRELLFELETARRQIFARDGASGELDLLAKCSANLMRMWAED